MTRRLLAALVVTAAGCSSAAPEPQVAPAPEPATTVFPTTPPTPGPAPALQLPAPERRELANGMEVLYVRRSGLPVAHVTLVTRGGLADDPARLPGLAAFTASMLDEGAGGRSSLQLSEALELLGAELSTGASWDAASVDLHVLSTRLDQALPLMADVVVRPDFPEKEVKRLRDERLTELARARDEARAIAANAFARLTYGAEHPYGRLASTGSVGRIGRADIASFHRSYYRPAGSTLVIVGDVDPAQVHPLVERAFGEWTGAPPSEPAIATPPETPATRIFLVDKPGAAQSEIRVGHPGVARDNPDYYPLLVLNTLLGGSFTSRLNTNLREVHGYSYGAGSSFSMRRGAGPFLASSAVFTAKTDSAVIEFFRELERIRAEPIPEGELERAKSYLALGLPRRFETTESLASQLATLAVYDLPLDDYNRYVPSVMAVTAEDVRRVANQYLRPDRSVVVVVGDRSTVEPGLRMLKLGPLELRETQDFVR